METSEPRFFTLEEIQQILDRGIHITSIVPPAQGWLIAMHCPICKETTIILHSWAIKPEKGDYWLMRNTCGSEEFQARHNLEMSMPKYKIMPGGYIDETGPHRGSPPSEADRVQAELMCAVRKMFAEKESTTDPEKPESR
jgi:hypothetical protein